MDDRDFDFCGGKLVKFHANNALLFGGLFDYRKSYLFKYAPTFKAKDLYPLRDERYKTATVKSLFQLISYYPSRRNCLVVRRNSTKGVNKRL